MSSHQPIVQRLIQLLEVKPELKPALEKSIRLAECLNVLTLEDYFKFLNGMVKMIPNERTSLPIVLEFFYLINQPADNKLSKDPLFQQWVVAFTQEWGSFLDTLESAKDLDTWYTDPAFRIGDFFQGPSGWLTFNQFFAREIRPGKRPIDGLCDDSVVVSPGDSIFAGQSPINDDSEITVKGLKWRISELLDIADHPEASQALKDRFKDGIFMHSFLNVNDYHRFHTPVAGKILYQWNIMGKVSLDVYKQADGSFNAKDGSTFQFTQERGLTIFESDSIGYVAVLPIGMGFVSSVNFTGEVGATLSKGEEYGYFAFGGSDIVMLFEKDKVNITAEVGTHYNQGIKIAKTV